jgi:hypothetical protein
MCPQSPPEWILAPEAAALGVSVTTLLADLEADGTTTTEDCLFLDVMVPKSIFNSRQNANFAGGMSWFSFLIFNLMLTQV